MPTYKPGWSTVSPSPLSTPRREHLMKSASNVKVHFTGFYGTEGQSPYQNRNKSVLISRLEKMTVKKYSVYDSVSCVKATQDIKENNVCMGSYSWGVISSQQNLVDRFGQPRFRQASEQLAKSPMVMYFSRKMPHLQSRFEQYTRGSFFPRIMEKWWEGWGVTNIALGRSRARKKYDAMLEQGVKIDDNGDETDSPINSILISIIGNGGGLVLFLIEVRKRVISRIKVLAGRAWGKMCAILRVYCCPSLTWKIEDTNFNRL
ncbi:hypothetical protein Fcan01_23660 [Folsomia candida]|uniref:Uncharacterized protein n=1 Tax=Folsomia candida TaxID=158441 RepID=A0A226D9J3_FOLCA|nr:hypothetical protein Fcan01_23660 [Folsomia candida]